MKNGNATMKIEKGIPMPTTNSGVRVYPFGEMSVGESFFVSDPLRKNNARMAAFASGKKHGRKYATRTVDGGLRVWRVK